MNGSDVDDAPPAAAPAPHAVAWLRRIAGALRALGAHVDAGAGRSARQARDASEAELPAPERSQDRRAPMHAPLEADVTVTDGSSALEAPSLGDRGQPSPSGAPSPRTFTEHVARALATGLSDNGGLRGPATPGNLATEDPARPQLSRRPATTERTRSADVRASAIRFSDFALAEPAGEQRDATERAPQGVEPSSAPASLPRHPLGDRTVPNEAQDATGAVEAMADHRAPASAVPLPTSAYDGARTRESGATGSRTVSQEPLARPGVATPPDLARVIPAGVYAARVVPLTRKALRAQRRLTWTSPFGVDGADEPTRAQLLAELAARSPGPDRDTLLASAYAEEIDSLRLVALEALTRRPSAVALPAFAEALQAGTDYERFLACAGLHAAGFPEARALLYAALADRSDAVAARALGALAHLAPEISLAAHAESVDPLRRDTIVALASAAS